MMFWLRHPRIGLIAVGRLPCHQLWGFKVGLLRRPNPPEGEIPWRWWWEWSTASIMTWHMSICPADPYWAANWTGRP